MASPFYSVGELSEVLRVCQKWVYQQLGKGTIPGAFKIGGVHFIDKDVFHSTLKQKSQKPTPKVKQVGGKDRHNLL